jgi:hypothetical protein
MIGYVDEQGRLALVSTEDGRDLAVKAGALPGVAPLIGRSRVLYAGGAGLITFALDRPDEEPIDWVDTSWLGRPTTPMVVSQSNVYMGMIGWGLVRFGESSF